MTNTIKLTDEKIDDYIQSCSVSELKKLWENSTPIQINQTEEEYKQSEKIWAIMDLTDLDYDSVEKILFEPKRATLGDIAIYCKRLNIHFLEFIEKALA